VFTTCYHVSQMMIQGTFSAIQRIFSVIQMMMMIISPFGQLGLWAPSSGVQDVFSLP
jgi:hypothetical protein